MPQTLLCLSLGAALSAPLPQAYAPGFALAVPSVCLTSEVAVSPVTGAAAMAFAWASTKALAGTGLAVTAESGASEAASLPVALPAPSSLRIVAAILGVAPQD